MGKNHGFNQSFYSLKIYIILYLFGIHRQNLKVIRNSYFRKNEHRFPHPISFSSQPLVRYGFRFVAILYVVFGIYYFYWRLFFSLNPEEILFSWLLLGAEFLSFIGSLLIFFNYGLNGDFDLKPERVQNQSQAGVPLAVDVFICTYNEDVDLVQTTVIEAKNMRHPNPFGKISIYVLDDGADGPELRGRQKMREMAELEGVTWLSRKDNEGFKAGNLQQGFLQSDGDLFLILDADTRVFPNFLEETMGYFEDPKVAWVQSPQWFYDLTPALGLGDFLIRKNKLKWSRVIRLLNKISIGKDVFGNDGALFYQVILHRRNQVNAAFCCGAGSLHRRSSVQEAAERRRRPGEDLRPFIFHASEDIYTSLHMHADSGKWRSVQHPVPLCRMLSPQNLEEWVKQRSRYASGSLDIGFRDNPLWKSGLSIWQRICYFQTIYAYVSPLWLVVFLASPLYFFFTLKSPLTAFSFDFFKYFFVFQMLNIIAVTLGTWGLCTTRSNQYYLASWWIILRSMVAVLLRKKVKFHVTDKSGKSVSGRIHLFPFWILLLLSILGWSYNLALVAGGTHPTYSGFFANVLWSLYNLYMCGIFVLAAYWPGEVED
jgi:cellulose synthase (UDP-forming)